jgi:pimeloyl-ACP methyl ester carboxylesterase
MMTEPKTQSIAFDDGASTTLESWGTTGPDILCVHGITSSRRSWLRFVDRFGDRYRVHAYDQRGHGDSAHIHGSMTLARSVRDLAQVADAVGRPLHALVGHSWGGAVVLLAGLEVAAERVVAIDPFVHADANFRSDYVEDLVPLFALPPGPRENKVRENYAAWHPLDVEGKIHAVRSMSVEPIERLGFENDIENDGWNVLPKLASYPKPVLFLVAGIESIISDDDQAWLAANLGTNADIIRFPDDGHSLHRTNFEAFALSVGEFLKEK